MAVFQTIRVILAALVIPTLALPTEIKSRANPNLIVNGGFETGELAPWVFRPAYTADRTSYEITSPGLVHEGKYKFEYDSRTHYDSNAEGIDAGFGIFQNITAVQGANYTISFKYLTRPKAPKDYGPTSASLLVRVGESQWHEIDAPKNKVTHFKQTFTASSSKLHVAIYLYSDPYYSDNTSQHSRIDGVSVTMI